MSAAPPARKNMVQVLLRFPPDLLEFADAEAERTFRSRSAWFRELVARELEASAGRGA